MNLRAHIVSVAAIFLLVGTSKMLSAQELGFSERFALSSNREAVLRELIPGTEAFYYYHCLYCQTTGRIAESRAHLDAWIKKYGLNEQNKKIQTRQFLLEYTSNKAATIDHLRTEFGIQLDHPAPRRDEAAELPSEISESEMDWTKLQKLHVHDLNQFETVALGFITQSLNSPETLRRWIERIDRIDIPGLISILERELKLSDSRGFGWAPIHSQLTASQLRELQLRIPSLIQSNAFVQAALRRIRPNDDQSIDDPLILKSHLEALEQFVMQLPESQNALKATVLYHRLVHGEKLGDFDRERFLRYLSLPIRRPYSSVDFLAKSKLNSPIDLNANFQADSLLAPVGSQNDHSLIERYLEHFFQAESSVDAFAPFIERGYLRRVFASVKILYGIGDTQQAYALLSPEEARELQARTEVNFEVSNQKFYRPSDAIRLGLRLKNVNELLLRIYRVNARNVLASQMRPIATDIDLDGLVANYEKRFQFNLPADRRHTEWIQLPEMDGGGVWVVDAIAGGMRSRSLVNKGHLHAIQFRNKSGDVLRVFDADGKPAKNAFALYAERQYEANEHGEIVIPFAEQSKLDQLILVDGPVATLQSFHHHQESYALQVGCLLDPQSLLAGSKATLLMRPILACNGEMVSLSQLEKPKLTLVSTDLDGIHSSQSFSDVQLSDAHEFEKSFIVPDRLASLNIILSGEVASSSASARIPVSASHSMTVNESRASSAIFDFYLSKLGASYVAEVRGRNGEPASRIPVKIEVKLHGIVPTFSLRVATNNEGTVALGTLRDVQWLQFSADSINTRTFSFSPLETHLPSTHHANQNDSIEFACSTTDRPSPNIYPTEYSPDQPSRFSLIEYRNGLPFSIHSNKIALSQGKLTIRGLEAGSYQLRDHVSGSSTNITVIQGALDRDVLVGNLKLIESHRVRPVHVQNVAINDDRIEVKIGNPDQGVRVHLVANAFLPTFRLEDSFPSPSLALSSISRISPPSFYLNGVKLDEEYQYVLQRQFAKKYLGSLLPQPSLILNPWELSASQNSKQEAATGDPLAAKALPPSSSNAPADAQKSLGKKREDGIPDYEFLRRGSVILANLACNDQGIVSIDRKRLQGLPNATLIVVHPSITVSHRFGLPFELSNREFSDRRLAKSFDSNKKLCEVQSVQVLSPNDKHDLGASNFTRVKLYSSLPEVYQLYKSLLQKQPQLSQFECLGEWNSLTERQKEVYYADLACHELHLFLSLHDRPFFDRVVRPHLRNKLQRQFMDDYLLEADLSPYFTPWRQAQLNVVERVLLAKRIENQTPRTKRWLKDSVDNQAMNSTRLDMFFKTALERDSLLDLSLVRGEVRNERFDFYLGLQKENKVQAQHLDRLERELREEGVPNQNLAQEWFRDLPSIDETLSEASGSTDKKAKQPSVGRAFSGGGMRGLYRKQSRLFESVETTRRWAESNYFRLPIQNQNAGLLVPNAFWLDFLNHTSDRPFVSKYVDQAASNLHEAILAMAVLDLPFKSEFVDLKLDNGHIVVSSQTPVIAFVQGIQESNLEDAPAKVLLGQDLSYASDPSESAKSISGETLTKGTVYRSRVVLTNPSATPVQLNVLRQIPQGAIPLENAKTVIGQVVDLAPFATLELNLKFYFPQSGTFTHYGAQVALGRKHLTDIPSKTWTVVDAPTNIDQSSWDHIANWGTNEQVTEHLTSANMMKTDLDRIAWRMNDKRFFVKTTQQLEECGVFHPTIWAYALRHDDLPRIREYLERSDAVVQRVGPSFQSDLIHVETVQRLTFEHLDFRPLIIARAHLLGPKRVILNDQLSIQYQQLMHILSHQSGMDAGQRLSIVYYLLLQNRFEEAIGQFEKIKSTDSNAVMQYDCFASYLGMIQGEFDEADSIARKYEQYPVPRWNEWFKQVRTQIADRKSLQAGRLPESQTKEIWQYEGTNRVLTGGREQQLADENEKLPVLQLVQQGDTITARTRNIDQLSINYYLMDVELLFSRNPFSQQNNGRWNSIEPNFTDTQVLDHRPSTQDVSIRVPDQLKNKSFAIEVLGGGLVRSTAVYANSLAVNLSPSMGRIQAFTKQQLKPLEGAYVKIYAKDASGTSRFYKDGYTDLRGQFDYASLSTNDLDTTQKFALLISHPQYGTLVYEADPPKR